MIVHIDDTFLDGEIDKICDDVFSICRILEQRHYIQVSGAVLEVLRKIVADNVPPYLAGIFQSARNYINPSTNKRRYLTTVNWNQLDKKSKHILFFKPSELLLENGPYEWNVYKTLINVFVEDNRYGDIFDYIRRMIEIHNLVPSHSGGIHMMPAITKMKNLNEFEGLYHMKCCAVMDRDTNSGYAFSRDNGNVLEFYSNKKFDDVKNEDVYKLDFSNWFVWHVLFKREIENYFPIIEYEKLDVDMSSAHNCDDYDYFKFDSSSKRNGTYQKEMLKVLGKTVTYNSMNSNVQKFNIDGVEYSEIQLLLLKIAKIV